MVTSSRRLADELLFPSAIATDRSPLLARELLDALAAEGLYGMAGPDGLGGGPPLPEGGHLDVIEILAGACLTTAFVWMQHHGAVLALLDDVPDELRARWLEPLCRGEVRAGAAFSGLRGSHGAQLRATPVDGGWRLDGSVPWVTGWGRIDVVRTAALTADETIVWVLVDAVASASVRITQLPLVALAATGTVRVAFDGHVVSSERVMSLQPLAQWRARDASAPTIHVNAAMALGIAGRSCMLRGRSALDDELLACRAELREATGEDRARLVAARAWAIDLAVRASHALVCAGGGRSLMLDHHAQRLSREALFLLVFAQNEELREAQLQLAATISGERVAAHAAPAAARGGS
jgi:alkylation response protein AidB-like acyl-CoA dehydrogenase